MKHSKACFAAHMGIYAMEPHWLAQAVRLIQAGHALPLPAAAAGPAPGQRAAKVQVVRISGPMFKGESKFSDANTIRIRNQIRAIARDPDVAGVLLAVDSPGGTVAGTADLAQEVRALAAQKPVHAFIEDLGASAAYWVASQASRITATPTTEVGSIGTMAVVEDTSGMAEMDGVVVHVVSTGDYKGAFTPGVPVDPVHLEELQERVNDLNAHFLRAVQMGRGLNAEAVQAAADGRVFIAEKARGLGLIDHVGSYDDAVEGLLAAIESRPNTSRRRRAAAKLKIMQMETLP